MKRFSVFCAILITIGVGRIMAADLDVEHWQLFIDDHAIARGTGLDRVVHHPKALGVVIDADKPWETHSVQPSYFCRKSDGTFLGYYNAHWWIPNTDARSASLPDVVYADGAWRTRKPYDGPQDRDQQYVSVGCFARSKDGIHWEKPNLGRVDAPSGIDREKYAPFPHPTGTSRENNVELPFGIFDLGQNGNVSDPAPTASIPT